MNISKYEKRRVKWPHPISDCNYMFVWFIFNMHKTTVFIPVVSSFSSPMGVMPFVLNSHDGTVKVSYFSVGLLVLILFYTNYHEWTLRNIYSHLSFCYWEKKPILKYTLNMQEIDKNIISFFKTTVLMYWGIKVNDWINAFGGIL